MHRLVQRGRLTLQLAPQATPARGNGRLVVISHGSGGAPWVHADLARQWVAAGFVVALPQRQGDNDRDPGRPGPDSWALRPAEVSRAIDAVAQHPRLAPLPALDKVGVYGMSAGGHTALSLAGFARHSQAHMAEDFQTCVGLITRLITRLTGGPLDGLKQWAARTVIGLKFDDDTPLSHHDPRVVAVVAGVRLAADFDLASLARPRVTLALVTARQDRWLIPAFHSHAVLAVCPGCERLADLPDGGHGALLSPLPPGLTGLAAALLNDPPGFDRSQLPALDRRSAGFFSRHLLQ